MHDASCQTENVVDVIVYDPGQIIANRWKIVKSVGAGSNGYVFSAIDMNDNSAMVVKKEYALKIQQSNTRSAIIETEINFYQLAKDISNNSKSPLRRLLFLFDFGFHKDGAIYFVAPLLGPSLDKLIEMATNKKLSVCSSLRLSRQALTGLEEVHRLGYTHRNVKPSNFALDYRSNGDHHLYIIDFGRVRLWSQKPDPDRHQLSRHDCYSGPLYFTSLNGHAKQILGRHDDLQSWLYIMAYLVLGRLPWFGNNTKKDYVAELKSEAEKNPLTLYAMYPSRIMRIYEYVKSLGYDDEPNYALILQLIDEALTEVCVYNCSNNHYPFDT